MIDESVSKMVQEHSHFHISTHQALADFQWVPVCMKRRFRRVAWAADPFNSKKRNEQKGRIQTMAESKKSKTEKLQEEKKVIEEELTTAAKKAGADRTAAASAGEKLGQFPDR